MQIKASQVKLKDKIILDFGYGPRTDDRPAQVLEISRCKKLFGEGENICFSVNSFGEIMDSSFDSDDLVTLA